MKRLLTIALAVAAVLGLTAVPANAAPLNHGHYYQVTAENCSIQLAIAGHWTSAGNPSNAQWVRAPHCGRMTDVNAGVTRVE